MLLAFSSLKILIILKMISKYSLLGGASWQVILIHYYALFFLIMPYYFLFHLFFVLLF